MGVMQMRPSYPSLWEEGIERRGQHVLWYSASACYCVSDNGRVDPNCPKCFGKGFTYAPATSTRRIIRSVAKGKAVNDLSSVGVNIKQVYGVFLKADQKIELTSFTTSSITPVTPIKKGVQFTLDYEHNLLSTYIGECTYLGKGIIEVPIKLINNQNYFAGHLVEVASLVNMTSGKSVKIEGVWANKILTSSVVYPGDELTIACQYVQALKFLITSINPKTKVDNNMILQKADAMMSFPGTYHIGRGDVIVLQMAEMKETIIGYNEGTSYTFPFQSVSRILRVEDKYGEITDYSLVRDNEIIWNGRRPERFSCSFMYHPTFAVLEDLPSVRYSENKIWPKRVFLKKFGCFTHSSKVLQIQDANAADQGILDDPSEYEEQGGLI
jgi:hypothetical protein